MHMKQKGLGQRGHGPRFRTDKENKEQQFDRHISLSESSI